MASGNQGPFEGVRPTILLGARGSPDRQDQHWHGQLDEVGAYTYGDPAHVHAATAAGRTHTYSYDANGAVLTRTEGASSYTHGYDVQGRQTRVAVAGGSGDEGLSGAHLAADGVRGSGTMPEVAGERRAHGPWDEASQPGGRPAAAVASGGPGGVRVAAPVADHAGNPGRHPGPALLCQLPAGVRRRTVCSAPTAAGGHPGRLSRRNRRVHPYAALESGN